MIARCCSNQQSQAVQTRLLTLDEYVNKSGNPPQPPDPNKSG
jgi:hypothetical protein